MKIIDYIFSDYIKEDYNAIKKIIEIIKIIFFRATCHLNLYIRLLSYAKRKEKKILIRYCEKKIYYKCSCWINPSAIFGENIKFPHPIGIVIGEGVVIGNNVKIYQNVTIGTKNTEIPKYPVIEDECVIFANSVILGEVTLGENTIIGANSLVINNTEPNSVYVGNPAKRIR